MDVSFNIIASQRFSSEQRATSRWSEEEKKHSSGLKRYDKMRTTCFADESLRQRTELRRGRTIGRKKENEGGETTVPEHSIEFLSIKWYSS